MRIKATWVLLSALAAVAAALMGCGGAAPASQTAEVAASPTANAALSMDSNSKDSNSKDSNSKTDAVEVGYKVGMHAPEFRMSLLDGSSVTTARLVEQGKPAFIYFHATW